MMDWAKVIAKLRDDAGGIRLRATAAFPDDFKAQREMLSRAALLSDIARALEAGLSEETA